MMECLSILDTFTFPSVSIALIFSLTNVQISRRAADVWQPAEMTQGWHNSKCSHNINTDSELKNHLKYYITFSFYIVLIN